MSHSAYVVEQCPCRPLSTYRRTAASAPTGTQFTDEASNDDFLEAVTYTQLASVVKQCEKGAGKSSEMLTASSAGSLRPRFSKNKKGNGNKKPSVSALKR